MSDTETAGADPARPGRDVLLARRFVELADTLVADYDVVDLLDVLVRSCVELLHVRAAGLLLVDQRGGLRLLASSSEESRLLELFQLQDRDGGPCLDCVRTGAHVAVQDLTAAEGRWPRFSAVAASLGFASALALPLRLRADVVGSLNLFDDRRGEVAADTVSIAQALADVATIGILQQRTRHRSDLLVEQLQSALHSRVVIEQAKGVLAAHGGIDMTAAYAVLRDHARRHNLKMAAVAHALVTRQLHPDAVSPPAAGLEP